MEELVQISKIEFQKFKKVDLENVGDLAEYVKKFYKDNPGCTIGIGSDSIQHKKWTIYAVMIALFYPKIGGTGRGAHLIYLKKKFTTRFSLWTRLWNEVEMSIDVAKYLKNNINLENIEVHIDINPDEEYKSNMAFQASIGYIKSLEFIPVAKPNSWVATCAADMIIK